MCCPSQKDASGREWHYGGNTAECYEGATDCGADNCVLYAECQGQTTCEKLLEEGDGHCTTDFDCRPGLTCGKPCREFAGRDIWGADTRELMCCYFKQEHEDKYLEPKDGATVLIYNVNHYRRYQRVQENEENKGFGISTG